MNKREKLVQETFLNNEEEVINRLKSTYQQSLKDIEKKTKALQDEINSLSSLYDSIEDEGEKARLKSMQQSKIYQKQYQDALKKQIGSILDNLQVEEFKTISDYLNKCYHEGFLGTMYDIHGQGIPLLLPIDQEAMIRAVQFESKISEGLYSHLGENVSDLKKRITSEVSRGISRGMTYSQIAQQISFRMMGTYDTLGGSLGYATRIARTEGHRIQVQSGLDACYKAKEKGADVVKQWDSTLDGNTRESHQMVDGEIRELDEKFSNGLRYPGDSSGGAAEVVNCRCALLQRAKWALDEEELAILKGRAEHFGLDKTDSFEDFKKKYLKGVEELQGNGENKVNITQIAIDKVKTIELDGYTLDDMKKLQNHHKDLLKTAMNNNNSNEVAKIFSTSFGKDVTVFGDESGVLINQDIGARAFMLKADKSSVILIHNHPKGTSFSYSDIGVFLQDKIKTLTIVTNRGKVYALNKTNTFDILGISGKIKEIRDGYDVPKDHQEEITKQILKVIGNYGVQYIK